MRKMFSVGLAAVLALCVAGTASAATSIDLVFATSGTSVTTITPGFSGTVVMRVILDSDDGLTTASTSVQWDNSGTDAVTGTGEWVGVAVAFNMMNFTVTASMTPQIPGVIDNVARVVTALDGLVPNPNNPPNLPAGTYQIGTIVWQTSGAAGNTNIASYKSGLDDFGVGGTFVTGTVSFGGGTINVVPEPGTASLLGLGLIGLIAAGRRNRA